MFNINALEIYTTDYSGAVIYESSIAVSTWKDSHFRRKN